MVRYSYFLIGTVAFLNATSFALPIREAYISAMTPRELKIYDARSLESCGGSGCSEESKHHHKLKSGVKVAYKVGTTAAKLALIRRELPEPVFARDFEVTESD